MCSIPLRCAGHVTGIIWSNAPSLKTLPKMSHPCGTLGAVSNYLKAHKCWPGSPLPGSDPLEVVTNDLMANKAKLHLQAELRWPDGTAEAHRDLHRFDTRADDLDFIAKPRDIRLALPAYKFNPCCEIRSPYVGPQGGARCELTN